MTSDERNQALVSEFRAGEKGKTLEHYLKNEAWLIDQEGETRVYLVKDNADQVALFFSIKCGLLYEPYEYTKLEETEQEFVNMLIDAKEQRDDELIQTYLKSGYYSLERAEELYELALQRYEVKCEGRQLKDETNAYKVSKCYSAIELCHFCKNVDYAIAEEIDVPLGFGIFWEIIVPKILEIAESIGCKYLYLFAADHSDEPGSEIMAKKLVRYYKNDLKFEDVQNMTIVKPQYDEFCYGLVQEVNRLEENRDAVWQSFSDH